MLERSSPVQLCYSEPLQRSTQWLEKVLIEFN